MKKIGNCVRCNKEILDIDDYFKLMEFLSGKNIRDALYCRNCYYDKMGIKRLAIGMAARTNRLLNLAEQRLT